MVAKNDLRKIARGRLQDADVLRRARRYDGAVYLAGYAVEIALKARICRTLKWLGYPSTRPEFRGYESFRTHDLDRLLHLSGSEAQIKGTLFAEWSVIGTWDPSVRYRAIGSAKAADARDMVTSASALVGVL